MSGVGLLYVAPRRVGGAVVLEVEGEIDVYTAPVLRDALDGVIGACEVLIVLDFERVAFLDSTGLGVLVGGYKRALEGGLALVLACVPARIAQVLAITGLDRVLPVFPSVDEALGAV